MGMSASPNVALVLQNDTEAPEGRGSHVEDNKLMVVVREGINFFGTQFLFGADETCEFAKEVAWTYVVDEDACVRYWYGSIASGRVFGDESSAECGVTRSEGDGLLRYRVNLAVRSKEYLNINMRGRSRLTRTLQNVLPFSVVFDASVGVSSGTVRK